MADIRLNWRTAAAVCSDTARDPWDPPEMKQRHFIHLLLLYIFKVCLKSTGQKEGSLVYVVRRAAGGKTDGPDL